MRAAQTRIVKHTDAEGNVIGYRFRVDVGTKVDKNGKVVRAQKMMTFPTLKEAKAELAKMQAALAAGVFVQPNDKLTVADLVARWTAAQSWDRPATRSDNENRCKPLLRMYGTLPVQKLTSDHLVALRDHRIALGRKPVTVNGNLKAAWAVLQYGVDTGVLGRNVANPRLVKRVKDRAHRARLRESRGAWTLADAQKFYLAIAEDRLRGAYLMSLIGLRRGEVCGLRWSDIDLETGHVQIRSNRISVGGKVYEDQDLKTEAAEREFDLPAAFVSALWAMRDRQATEEMAAAEAGVPYFSTDLIVRDEIGRPIQPEVYADGFVRVSTAAGLPRIVLHGLRNTAASLLHAMGVPVKVAMAILGQSEQAVHLAYIFAQDDDVDGALANLGALLRGE